MEYISVAAFAEAAGVTVQAVYKRIKTDLAPFVKEENGVKLLSTEALELYKPSQTSKREKELQDRLKALEQENEELKEQKTELLEKLAANSEKLAETNEKLLEILTNHQVLMAQAQQLNSLLLQPPSTVEPQEEELKEVELNEKKQGLIARIFKRRK